MYCRCYYKPSMIKDNGKWEEPISFLIYVFGSIFWYRVSWILFQNILRRKTFSITPIFIFLHRIERFQIYEVTLSQSLSCNLFSEIIFAEDYRSGKYYFLIIIFLLLFRKWSISRTLVSLMTLLSFWICEIITHCNDLFPLISAAGAI